MALFVYLLENERLSSNMRVVGSILGSCGDPYSFHSYKYNINWLLFKNH